MKPITPQEVSSKRAQFPPEVIQVFNELIIEKMRGSQAIVLQDEAVDRIIKLMNPDGFSSGQYDSGADKERAFRQSIFDRGWLDVEDTFRAAGWKVGFDKPAYNETYAASFTFSAR